jgi:hypothetical protein
MCNLKNTCMMYVTRAFYYYIYVCVGYTTPQVWNAILHLYTNQTNSTTKQGSQPTYPSTHPLTISAPDPQKRNPSSTHPHLESRFNFTETQFPPSILGWRRRRRFARGGGGNGGRVSSGSSGGFWSSTRALHLSPSASPLQTACIFVDGSRSGVRRCQGGLWWCAAEEGLAEEVRVPLAPRAPGEHSPTCRTVFVPWCPWMC